MTNTFYIELIFKPSIPDNVTNWRVFYNDEQIIKLLILENTFKDSDINELQHNESLKYPIKYLENQTNEDKIEFGDIIPTIVFIHENFYDLKDKFKKNKICNTNSSLM